MADPSYDAARHYDRVTRAWGLLLGDDLHYGLFATGTETLAEATRALTDRMVRAAAIEPDVEVLDVGCGTGTPACVLTRDHGARVTGITTSPVGVEAATARAVAAGVGGLARFEVRDGTDNGYPDASFDRVWVLESSHLMRARGRLIAECARVLRPGGVLALCDIVLRRPLSFSDVRRLREPLTLLRHVFGDAHMEPLGRYAELAEEHGLVVDGLTDLTAATRPTFARWRDNARRHGDEVVALLGEAGWARFVDSCTVLEGLWDDGTLGYGLLAAHRGAREGHGPGDGRPDGS
ncbi:MAG: methyltransferase domain-containing protein [Acidimicrobiia bacterium]|nr:methyltransferase domain-containing protein [Acidimicrobiia bacterium]